MSTTELLPQPTQTTATTPRALRGAAAVMAQYIQDLTTQVTPGPCPSAA